MFWACLQNNDNFFPYSQLILILKLSFLNIPWYMKKDIWCCFRFDGVFLLLSHHRKQKCSIKLQNSSLFFSLNNGSQRWYERVEPDRTNAFWLVCASYSIAKDLPLFNIQPKMTISIQLYLSVYKIKLFSTSDDDDDDDDDDDCYYCYNPLRKSLKISVLIKRINCNTT